jgi:hypothetical protein
LKNPKNKRSDKTPKMVPPKKTGKRGINPVDGFETPTRQEQPELLTVAEQPSPRIQHGKMSVHFVSFTTKRSKNDDPLVFLDFSLELEEGHEGRIPKQIEDEWKHFRRGSVKRTEPEGVGSQNVKISIAADKSPDLEIVAALPKAIISHVKTKGKGKTQSITRLQLRFLTSFTADVADFCEKSFDRPVWLEMEESQMSFGEEEAAD